MGETTDKPDNGNENENDEPAVDLEKILKDYHVTKPPERKDNK